MEREQHTGRVMDVMHIDFFPPIKETEAGREGLGGGGRGRTVVYLQ